MIPQSLVSGNPNPEVNQSEPLIPQSSGYEVYSPKSVSPSRNLQEVHQVRALEDSNHPLPIHSGKKGLQVHFQSSTIGTYAPPIRNNTYGNPYAEGDPHLGYSELENHTPPKIKPNQHFNRNQSKPKDWASLFSAQCPSKSMN